MACVLGGLTNAACTRGQSGPGGQLTSFVVLGVARTAITPGCESDPSYPLFDDEIFFDTDVSHAMHLSLVLENQSSVGLTPVQASVRWECDSSAFAQTVGPLFLPTLKADPFCLPSQKQTNDPVLGFEPVALNGGLIASMSRGTVRIEALPTAVGDAFDTVMVKAPFADMCCRAPNSNCDGHDPSSPGCAEIAAFFQSLHPALSISSGAPGSPSGDLENYAAFSIFNGQYYDRVLGPRAPQFGARYRMRLHARIEATSPDGRTVQADFLQMVGLCKACGLLARGSITRAPYPRSECMR